MAGFALGEDRAYWISWFNLPDNITDERRHEFLTWAYDVYVPRVLARGGLLWGALYASQPKGSFTPLGGGGRISHKKNPKGVPVGDRYIMMFGAMDAYALADPMPDEFHAQFNKADTKMLDLRKDERRNIMLEEATVYGPQANCAREDSGSTVSYASTTVTFAPASVSSRGELAIFAPMVMAQ